ncbi:hypothetical protein Hdeb2414_s0011g00361931 [Helianthus debilis subsp. tardiflorus]
MLIHFGVCLNPKHNLVALLNKNARGATDYRQIILYFNRRAASHYTHKGFLMNCLGSNDTIVATIDGYQIVITKDIIRASLQLGAQDQWETSYAPVLRDRILRAFGYVGQDEMARCIFTDCKDATPSLHANAPPTDTPLLGEIIQEENCDPTTAPTWIEISNGVVQLFEAAEDEDAPVHVHQSAAFQLSVNLQQPPVVIDGPVVEELVINEHVVSEPVVVEPVQEQCHEPI